jgi:TonB family protein
MSGVRRIVGSALFAAALLIPALAVPAEEQTGVLTVVRVLVGKPEAVAAPTTQVLDYPGPFILLGRSAEQEAKDVLQLIDKLKENYRVAEVTITSTSVSLMKSARETAIAVPGAAVQASITLLAFDDSNALFSVTLAKEGEKPSTSKLLIARGERGVVGTRDGVQAPYLFLTIEPLPFSTRPGASPAVYPTLITRVQPEYPTGAKATKIEGVVVLEGTIDTQGVVRDLKPMRSEPMGLTEAAIKAVSQWRYTPARDAAGHAIAMPTTLTISFTLH